jgi:hypothetical protein
MPKIGVSRCSWSRLTSRLATGSARGTSSGRILKRYQRSATNFPNVSGSAGCERDASLGVAVHDRPIDVEKRLAVACEHAADA